MDKKTTGFASPAQGYEDQSIDLNRLLIHNPPATYFVRLDTSDMAELGLARGSLLVVDRSKDPGPNSLVLIRHEGRFLCRLLTTSGNKPAFTNGKETIHPIPDETEIIGTVTASIKTYGNAH
jgi:DNA polymerase V